MTKVFIIVTLFGFIFLARGTSMQAEDLIQKCKIACQAQESFLLCIENCEALLDDLIDQSFPLTCTWYFCSASGDCASHYKSECGCCPAGSQMMCC